MSHSDRTTGPRPAPARTIALVDDDEAVARLCGRLLTRMGYAVETFTAPQTAFERVAGHPHAFDAIITDHRMPGMTGQELLERLRAAGVSIPAMIVSGFSEEIDRSRFPESGVPPIVDKPFTREELAHHLDRLLSDSSSRRA